MKSKWWVAASLMVGLGLLFQPGCGKQPQLSTEASPDEPIDDLMTGDETLEGGDPAGDDLEP